MAHIEIKKRKGRNYAYYVEGNPNTERTYRYIDPIANTESRGVTCPRCGKILREKVIREMIAGQLKGTRDKMVEGKEHLSDYGRFAIVEELIKAFSEVL